MPMQTPSKPKNKEKREGEKSRDKEEANKQPFHNLLQNGKPKIFKFPRKDGNNKASQSLVQNAAQDTLKHWTNGSFKLMAQHKKFEDIIFCSIEVHTKVIDLVSIFRTNTFVSSI